MYAEESVTGLDSNSRIRLRPGMYLGGVDEHAFYEWLYVPFSEAVELAVHGYCSSLDITLRHHNEITITYDGPGIPTHITKNMYDQDISSLELMMTSNVFWNEDFSDFSPGGLMGGRLNILNALAATLTVETKWHGSLCQQHYRKGKPISHIEQVRSLEPDEETGVSVIFRPDFTILEPHIVDFDKLSIRLQETAWLTPQLTITLRDERTKPANEVVFNYENGLSDYVQYLNQSKSALTPIIAVREVIKPSSGTYRRLPFAVQFAFQYIDSQEITEVSYVSHIRTTHGGVHVAAFHTALFSALTQYPLLNAYPRIVDQPATIAFDAIFPGLTTAIHILHADPDFASQHEMRFVTPDAYGPISTIVFDTVYKYLAENPEVTHTIIEKCLRNQRELLQSASTDN